MLELKRNNEDEDYVYILNFNSTNGSLQIKIFVTKPINQKYLQTKNVNKLGQCRVRAGLV